MSGVIDSRTIADESIAGLAYRVDVDADDYYYNQPEGDGFTPRQVAAFRRGDWYYVTVSITPVIDGSPYPDASDSLGCVEYGEFLMTDEDDNETGRVWLDLETFINGKVGADGKELSEPYPVPDMIAEVRHNLVTQLGPKVDGLRRVLAELETVGK